MQQEERRRTTESIWTDPDPLLLSETTRPAGLGVLEWRIKCMGFKQDASALWHVIAAFLILVGILGIGYNGAQIFYDADRSQKWIDVMSLLISSGCLATWALTSHGSGTAGPHQSDHPARSGNNN